MTGYITYFENGGKNMIKDDEVWEKYEKIQDVIKNKRGIKFHNKPIYEQKYLKAKIREFDGVIKTNMHYTCIACITIDSVMRIDKENHLQVYLEECKYEIKKIQMSGFINTELKSDSDSEEESKVDAELMTKLESGPDSE